MQPGENTQEDIFHRVAKALAANEKDPAHWEQVFFDNMQRGAIGAGRIMAAAGLDTKATLINCFVQPVADATNGFDENGKPGIYTALAQAAETMRRGGGVGYDFSKLRPKGSKVKGTHSFASGPCSFIDVFDASCTTVESAGARRGAQMGVMRIDHPDIEEFIEAKRTKGRWNNFNVSVGVTHAFMEAVETDAEWHLVHAAEPSESQNAKKSVCGRWIYKTVKARALWDKIMQSAYDYAEPGILFLDNINQENNLWYCETIEATNPCVTGDTTILTRQGHVRIDSLVGSETEVWNGAEWSTVKPEITGRNQEIIDFTFSDGAMLSCTPYHKFILSDGSRIEAKDLTDDHKLSKWDRPVVESGDDTPNKWAYTQGFYSGDGQAGTKRIWLYGEKRELAEHMNLSSVCDLVGRDMATMKVEPFAKDFVPDCTLSVKSRLEWLAGLMDSDGTVTADGSVSIWSVDREFLTRVKLMLSTVGADGTLALGKPACTKPLPDGRGGVADYPCQDCYRLSISATYAQAMVGLGLNTYRLDLSYKPQRDASRFVRVVSAHLRSKREAFVYCFNEQTRHAGVFNGVLTAQCGEQPLPDYGCCDLGPIILTKFVRDAFTDHASFDIDGFRESVKTQVRMLDNVLDVTAWPLPEQQAEAQAKRRIGVGFTGLGDALIMLGFRYDSVEGRCMAEGIAEQMRDAAYEASIQLAIVKGAFPLFDADKYLQSGFAKRLPKRIREGIKKYGIRNSHLLSIAPTGTVSLAFADNASNGIEPPFSWSYTRKKRMADGSESFYTVEDHAHRLYREMHPEGPLPKYFVNALEISAEDHLAMMEFVQPYIDTAISKTVNVPADYPFDDFKQMYMQAWKSGLKGCATYRPNDTLGAVLSVSASVAAPVAPVAPATPVTVDRRPEGPLPAINSKVEYYAHDGKRRLYISVSFLNGEPIEFFMPVARGGESQQWLTATMRSLSLAARGGFVHKALEDMRKVTWEHGAIRHGTRTKDDGTVVPMWHDSEVALLAYEIQQIISGQVSAPAAPVPEPVTTSGKKCPECGAHAVIKKDGCSFCTSCGHMGSCG